MEDPASADPQSPLPPKPKWYHQPWFVLLMISPFALGPFGLPLLWKSPRFPRWAKTALTVFTVAWTVWFVQYVVVQVVPAVQREVSQVLRAIP